MVFTEEELFEDCERIASRFSKLKKNTFSTIWESICRYIEHQLVNGKACSLAGLGKFSFKLKKMDTGTQGIIEQRIPVFVLSESFIRMYQLRTLKQHVSNEIPIVEVNYFLCAQRAATRKEIVTMVLKIIYSRIGEIMSTGKLVNIDIRVGKLISDRKIVEFVFNKQFKEPIGFKYFELPKNGPQKSSTKERILVSQPSSLTGGMDNMDTNINNLAQRPSTTIGSYVHEGVNSDVEPNNTDSLKKYSSRIAMNHKVAAISSFPSKPSSPSFNTTTEKEKNDAIISPKKGVKLSGNGFMEVDGSQVLFSKRDATVKSPTNNENEKTQEDDEKEEITKKFTTAEPNNDQVLEPLVRSKSVQEGKTFLNSPSSEKSRSSVTSLNAAAFTPQSFSPLIKRHPNVGSIEKTIEDACSRLEKSLEKNKLIEEKQFQQEKMQHMINAEVDKHIREQKRKRNKELQDYLKTQMEEGVKKREQETKHEKTASFPPINSSPNSAPHSPGSSKHSSFADPNDKEWKMRNKRTMQEELKKQLDKQVEERKTLESRNRAFELDQEWRMLEQAAKDYEHDMNYLKMRKMETKKLLSQAWGNQISYKMNTSSNIPSPHSRLPLSPSNSLGDQ